MKRHQTADGRFAIHASTLKTWAKCPRKAIYSAMGEGEDSSPALELGTAVHAVIEDFLRDGKAPDTSTREGAIANLAGPFLTKLRATAVLQVELPFTFESEGLIFQGHIDVVAEDQDSKWIVDHKTSSNPRKYAPSSEELSNDPQAIIYSHAVGASHAIFSYMGTKTREHRLVKCTPQPLKKILPIAHQLNAAQAAGPDSAPANTDSCHLYNRPCPHIKYCSAIKRITTMPTTRERLLRIIESPHDQSGWGLVNQAHTMACEANGVEDYKLVGFGKGVGAMRVCLRELLKDRDEQITLWGVDNPMMADCLPVFLEWASRVEVV